MDLLLRVMGWLRNPLVAAPVICALLLSTGFLYTGLLFEWGPEVIRPASAQAVHLAVTSAKGEVLGSIGGVQGQLKSLADTQDTIQKQQRADRLERLEQQMLWYREKNCAARTPEAKRLYYDKLGELEGRYRAITSTDWHEPTCKDVGG